MPQQIGWSVEAKLLYEIKQLTRQLSGRQYILTFPTFASFPIPGITGTLYVDEATGDIYVWNGTAYTILSSGITALNGLIAAAQLLTTGSTGTDFNISSVGTTHTFNIPTASSSNRGLLSSGDWTTFNNKQNALAFGSVSTSTSGVTITNGASSTVGPNVTVNIATASSIQNGLLSSTDWSTFNNKQNAITLTTTGTSGAATLVGSTLNIPQYQSVLTNPVTGTGTTNYIPKFTAGSTIGNSQIFDNGTNVGLGTASPGAKFHLLSATGTAQTQGDFANNLAIMQGASRTGTTAVGGSFATTLSLQSNDDVITAGSGASIGFAAKWNTGLYSSAAQFGSIFGGKENSTDANLAGYLSFATRPAGGNPTERLRITSGGVVAINTQTPDVGTILHTARGSNGTVATFGIQGLTINPRIRIDASETNNTVSFNTNYNGGTSPAITFLTTEVERLRITSGGDVGIGTASPSQKLHVSGGNILVQRAYSSGNIPLEILNSAVPSKGQSFDVGFFQSNDAPSIRITEVLSADNSIVGELTLSAGDGNVQLIGSTGPMVFNAGRANSSPGYAVGPNHLRIHANGRVGINTTTDAGYQLDVNGTARINSDLRINSTTGFNTLFTQAIGGGGLAMVSQTDATASGQRLYSLGFGSINYPAQARVQAYATEVWSSTNRGTALTFNTTPNGGTGVQERMFIGNDGFVGVNTSSPLARMHIAGNLRADNDANFATTSGNVGIGTASPQRKVVSEVIAANDFNFAATSASLGTVGNWVGYLYGFSGNTYQKGATFFESIDGNARGKFHIAMNDAATAANVTLADARLTVTSAGNVGIGIASPLYKMHVLNTAGESSLFLESGTTTQAALYLANANNAIYNDNSTTNNLKFFVNSATRMTINPAGELLINTTTDAGDYKLQVVGNQYLSGKLVVGTTSDSGQTVQINSSLRLIPTSTVPTASAGTLYYDTATNKLKLYDGTSWVDLN